MMKYLHYPFILILFLTSYATSSAGILATDIGWKCLGNDSFLVTIYVYRDCTDTLVAPGSVNIASDQNPCYATSPVNFSVPLQVISTTDVTSSKDCSESLSCTKCSSPSCSYPYGVQKITLQAVVSLSGYTCCYWRFSWQQQRRSAAITTGPANTDLYTEAWMNKCVTPCNNSPEFSVPPVHILCDFDRLYTYNGETNSDIDSNGAIYDSLSYNIVSPKTGPTANVQYNSNYSYTKPLRSLSPNYTGFSYSDGRLWTVPSVSLNVNDKSIFTTEVKELRNNIHISTIRREHYIVVDTICDVSRGNTLILATRDEQGNTYSGNEIIICRTDSACFTINVTHAPEFAFCRNSNTY